MTTTPATVPGRSNQLPGGLLLRTAVPSDLEQIGTLLAERGEPADSVDHRLVMEDEDAGWSTCAVVVDGERVVSTATLLDEELLLAVPGSAAPLRVPAGQVELVATDREYEGRGLVRALMNWAHDRSAARGHVVQVMIGIPYFYRLFGYSYAIDIAPRRNLRTPLAGAPSSGGLCTVRPATHADLPAMTALQAEAQQVSDLRMPHSAACWRWLLSRDGSTSWVVERDGAVVATGRTTPPEEGVLLAEVAATDRDATLALFEHADALAGTVGDEREPVRIAHRPGTVVGGLVEELCEPASPEPEQYYVRVPDDVRLLEHLRPLLQGRLDAAGIVPDVDVVVSTFRRHVRIPVFDGRLGPAEGGGTMQAPGTAGGAGVAPDQLGPMLFGPHGIVGLSHRHPDVYPGRHHDLMAALFTPLTSDLLTFYLP